MRHHNHNLRENIKIIKEIIETEVEEDVIITEEDEAVAERIEILISRRSHVFDAIKRATLHRAVQTDCLSYKRHMRLKKTTHMKRMH